jgi:hypothetical protein
VKCISIAALWLCACASVPDLHFVNADDAGVDGSSGTETRDGGRNDTCSEPMPEGARCCGTVWCIGACDDSNCDECASRCGAGGVCCGKSGNVVCKGKCP